MQKTLGSSGDGQPLGQFETPPVILHTDTQQSDKKFVWRNMHGLMFR
jgi:hypothetical protein